MATTTSSSMIKPEVFSDMVQGKFKGKLVIANFAKTDTSLVGNPGEKVNFPKWGTLQDIENDSTETTDLVPEAMSTDNVSATVKEVGKAVEITDRALLTGFGDPIGEAATQVGKVVARKIDADLVTEATTNCKASNIISNTDTSSFSDKVADAKSLWGDEAEEIAVLLVHSKMYTFLLKDSNFISQDKYPAGVLITGAIGTLFGVPVMITDRMPCKDTLDSGQVVTSRVATSLMLQRDALAYITKRAPLVETGRDILGRKTIITCNAHYAVKLVNKDGLAVIKHELITQP